MQPSKMRLFPRGVYFLNGVGVAVSFAPIKFDQHLGMELPSDHYDFPGPINVKGKSQQQICQEVNDVMKANQ